MHVYVTDMPFVMPFIDALAVFAPQCLLIALPLWRAVHVVLFEGSLTP